MLKFAPHANRCRTTESFLINQIGEELIVLNHDDGAILPGVAYTNCVKLLIVNLYV